MILHTVYTHIFLLQQLKEEVQRQMDQQNQLQMKYVTVSEKTGLIAHLKVSRNVSFKYSEWLRIPAGQWW